MINTITPLRIFQLCLVLMLVIYVLLPGTVIITFPVNLIGAVLLIGGLYLARYSKRLFKVTGTPILPTAKPIKLHTSGPFEYTRNPMYLGVTIALLGTAILTGSLVNFIFPALFMVMMDRFFIPTEEANLRHEFGEQFEAYRKQTSRWL
ncbi:MAG: isoprenylcysteine carboxylmethyltransferase family protein [Chloroflexi bacterium]|nr:isoprenylcysteine carboxylmethyltransferase family protein [Chloroflexota bacterium]